MEIKASCPLCGTDSPYELYAYGDIYLYHCDICTDFFISRSADSWTDKHERHRKAYFSQVAASYKGKKDTGNYECAW